MPDMVPNQFNPSISHPFYFIRKFLFQAIKQNSHFLTGRLMDFGCGSKPYKSLFNVEEYLGVDYYNEGHPHENEQIDVFYDGKTLPFPDNYFDSVLCSEVFEHIFNLDEILKEINRVMKPGSQIMITCPFVWNEHEIPYDFARYTRFALQDMLNKNGFEILHFEKAGNFITTITQLWILYWHTILYKKIKKVSALRILYKGFFVILPNGLGIILNKLLRSESSLYLNNVVVAKKN